jgi:hypothetical protein
MNAGEALDFAKDPLSYPPITVTAAAAKNMDLALTFCQNIQAYPTSGVAKNFATALAAAVKLPTVDAMLKAIADYFNSTKGFKGLDFPSYSAVSTFIRSFSWV